MEKAPIKDVSKIMDELDEFSFVESTTPIIPADMGYVHTKDIRPRYQSTQAAQSLTEEKAYSDTDAVCIRVNCKHPDDKIEFDDMISTLEQFVTNYENLTIGNYDSGVPQDDWSGWDISPVIDILGVRI